MTHKIMVSTATLIKDMDGLPFGFTVDKPDPLLYKNAISRIKDLIPIKQLKFEQKKTLVTSCWNEGFWKDVIIDGQLIDKTIAIKAVEELEESDFKSNIEEKKLGNKLLEMTLIGYERMYERVSLVDVTKYSFPKFEKGKEEEKDEKDKKGSRKIKISIYMETKYVKNLSLIHI